MRLVIGLVLLSFSVTTLAADKQYWLEPYLNYSLNSQSDDGTNTESLTSYGASLKLYGYFARGFYVGLKGSYGLYEISDSDNYSEFSASQTGAGLVLGALFGQRVRLWATYNIVDQFNTTATVTGTSVEVENTYKGSGYGLAANFWMFPWLTVGVEHMISVYNEDDDGSLDDNLMINTTSFILTFPLNL